MRASILTGQIGLASLALLLSVGTAGAANKFVSPAGSSSWANANSPVTPASLATANASVLAGDVVHMAPGNYTTAINPVRGGSSTSRIVYMGAAGDSSSVIVPSVTLADKDYVTVKWLKVTGGVAITDNLGASFSMGDSLYFASVGGGIEIVGAYGATVAHVVGGKQGSSTGRLNISRTTPGSGSGFSPHNVLVTDSRFYYGVGTSSCGYGVRLDRAINPILRRSQFYLTVAAGTADGACVHAQTFYGTQGGRFEDCRWEISNKSSIDNSYAWQMRDSCRFNTAIRCTVLTDTSQAGSNSFSMSGSGAYNNSCAYNAFYSCVLNITGLFRQTGGGKGYTFDHCQITYGYESPNSEGLVGDSLVFTHNTVVATHAHSGANPWCWDQQAVSPLANATLTDNIFVTTRHAATSAPWAWYYSGSTTVDRNLYFNFSDPTTTTNIVHYNGNGRSVGPTGTACSANGKDCQSVFADPRFANRGVRDYTPLIGSPAVSSGWPDGYVGAIALATGPDVTPPATVTNLAVQTVSDATIVLSWTAPGDDGSTGFVSAYDLRWSESPLTAGNFDQATPVSPQPAIGLPGSQQTYVLTGLLPNRTHYLALRARDEANNVSGLSNVVQATTLVSDQIPPAIVTDLTVTP